MSRNERFALALLTSTAMLCSGAGCRRNEAPEGADRSAGEGPRKPAELLLFSKELRVEDTSVNNFVERAMAECASGDYDRFRRLWSVREDPLSRGEYEEGWQAVRRIRIRALEKVMLAPLPEQGYPQNRTVYTVLAHVALDPAHRAGQREPDRQAVLMLTRERDEWRLAHPPKTMRTWIKELVARRNATPAGPAAPPTTSDESP